MSKFDEQYLDLCERILKEGEKITTNPAVLKKKVDKKTGLKFYFQILNLKSNCAIPSDYNSFASAKAETKYTRPLFSQ